MVMKFKDLSKEEQKLLNELARKAMLKQRDEFVKDSRYKDIDPENIWYLKLDYINSWSYDDNYIFTKCDCGSLEFDCLSDTPSSNQSRKCLMKCKKCGKTHIEYN